MSYAFQQDVVLLLPPILHRMLLFANLHPECRNKYRSAAVLPSPEGLQVNNAFLVPNGASLVPNGAFLAIIYTFAGVLTSGWHLKAAN